MCVVKYKRSKLAPAVASQATEPSMPAKPVVTAPRAELPRIWEFAPVGSVQRGGGRRWRLMRGW